ncbi:hypothetical protein SAMN06295974_1858 [Plantibacter flavus]|uniref:Uncharacterized protein n=1 Tax=Plantibacter flavus TaxID=150123 RepID=A0A3N2C8Z8_9MICO|nr:hypothetical protein [Plantibacter flavus]ROR83784.1 hypothetical protein EDD42_3901 [Plantibacter flavus]SMG27393.1 hypothetical protein SAMN06295974_1858 [Plantibacter flavus]
MSDIEPPVTRAGPQPLQIRQGLTAGSIVAAFLTVIVGVRAGFGVAEYFGSALCFAELVLAAYLVMTRVNLARGRSR